MAIDSAAAHNFTFTPAFSIFVICESESELEKLYEALNTGGEALMPLDNYGFSRKFGWVKDRYGVSWQMNLP
jgi:predicted 3-demethylubiquinone-9 3-methyltransferase (glyoxalase superfamily)